MKSRIHKFLCLAAYVLLLPVSGMACLNEYGFHGTKGNGYNDLHGFEELPQRHFGKLEHHDTLCRDYKDSSDYAVYLLKQGYVGRGLGMLLKLSDAHPDEYEIAANLGTAYELSGLNDSALKWIEYSLTMNPNAHEGTEWIHTDILKAKIAIAKDANWLKTHHVLNFDRNGLGNSIFSKNPVDEILREVLRSIYVQLNERLPFTSPGDLIMGDICTDAALLIENTSIEVGMAWWKLADEFGVPAVSPDPKDKMKKLKQIGRSIPVIDGLVTIPINDSTGNNTTHAQQYVHLSFLSFNKFSESKAWKLKDAELLKKVIADLQQPKMVFKLNLVPNPYKSSTINTLWIWISGIVVVLLLIVLVINHKKQ